MSAAAALLADASSGPRLVTDAARPVQLCGIVKRFGRVGVLHGVDLQLGPGRVTAVLGPNGAGKSTLIRILLGLTRADAGSVLIDGSPVGHDPSWRERLGYMPQAARFPENLTGREVMAMLRDLRGAPSGLDEELLERFALRDALDKPVRTLSGGTRQKLSAAVAFLFRPAVLVLDEPTAGLDPLASGQLKDKVRAAKEGGASVLLTSHVMSEVEEMADDIALLLEGRIRFRGSLRRLREETGEARLERAVARAMSPGGAVS